MPYKREGSPYYQVRRRNLPGFGDSSVLSSKVKIKKLAYDMERCLDELAQKALEDPSWYALLNAVCREKTVTLPALLKAKNTGTLEGLKRSLSDPLIAEAVATFQELATYDRPTGFGLDMLLHYTPAETRLGDLTSKKITRLCVEAEQDGRKRNTVRRQLLRAISKLLRFHLGNAERNRIFADVQYAGENDTREIFLTPEEIRRLLQASQVESQEFATLVRIALQTSADRGVLLSGKNMNKKLRGLLVRDVSIYKDNQSGAYKGELFLHDTKTTARSRSVPITDSLCRELLVLCANKSPDDSVFSIKYQQLDFLWRRARKAAGLKGVRFKDLRAQTAIYAEEAGIPQTIVQRTLGHSNEAMTRRYQQRVATLSDQQAEAIEGAMLGGPGKEEKKAISR